MQNNKNLSAKEIELLKDGDKALNALMNSIEITLEFQEQPLLCRIITPSSVISTSDYNTHKSVPELFEDVISILEGENLQKDENQNVFIAWQTDVWYSNSSRKIIGVFSSEIQAVISSMKHTGEVLVEDSGGYKSIREGCDRCVIVTQYKIDEVEE